MPANKRHDPGCDGYGLSAGIYDGYLEDGRFDIGFNPPEAHQASSVAMRAILCGTSDEDDTFYRNLKLTFPVGDRFTCARPSPTVAQCDGNGNGSIDPNENTEDGAYAGSGTIDYWCGGEACTMFSMNTNDDANVQIHVDRSENPHCSASASLVACYQIDNPDAPYLLPDYLPRACPADMIVRRTTRPANSQYTATLYQPDCGDDSETIVDESGDVISYVEHLWAPVYFLTIDLLDLCEFAGDPGDTDCDASQAFKPTPQAGNAIFFNGDAGSFKILLESQLTTGAGPWAVHYGTWL